MKSLLVLLLFRKMTDIAWTGATLSLVGIHAALGVALAIIQRHQSGEGQVVDVALYESVFNLLEGIIPEFDGAGVVREPSGSTITGIVTTNTYLCGDQKHVVIGGNGDRFILRDNWAQGDQLPKESE